MTRVHAALLACVLILTSCASGGGASRSPDAAAAFDAEVDAITRRYMELSPESATVLGAPEDVAGAGYNARLSDMSPEGEVARRAALAEMTARLRSIDPADLDPERALTHEVLLRQGEASLAAAQVPYGVASLGFFLVYPVNQLASPATDIFQIMQAQQPIATREDAEAYIARLEAFGDAFDGLIASLEANASAGAIPPDFVIERTREIIARFLSARPAQHSLVTTLSDKLEAAGIEDADLVARAEAAIDNVVYPAYVRLDAALAALEPQATHDAGIWRLPGGEELYQSLIRLHADSDLTADEVHALGLAEVARITHEMDAILISLGRTRGTVGERMEALSEEAEFRFEPTAEGREEIVAAANAGIAAITPLLPQWFGETPPRPVEVRRVPEAVEDGQARGYYSPPPLDGGAPGIFWINLRDTALWPAWSIKTVAYHEAVPGHHFQIALSLDQEDTPLLRKMYGVGTTAAFGEGWGLYAEQLAADMGMYADDPYGDLGRLQAELWRAVRLVVDTGLHAKRWSREQAIDYMLATGAVPEPADAITEVERYAVAPGQALSYKLGMLKLLELRERAKEALGEDFDIRAFHDALLLDGGLPLPILEARMESWLAAQQAPAIAADDGDEPATQASADADAAHASFDALVADLTKEWFQANPESATAWGVSEEVAGGPYNGRLSKAGLEARAETEAMVRNMIARLEAVDPATLDDDRRLTREVLIAQLGVALAVTEASGGYGRVAPGSYTVIYPITQLSGVHVDLPMFMEGQQPLTDAQDAADYISRLEQFGTVFDGTIEEVRHDAAMGVLPPDFAMADAIAVVEAFTATPAAESPLYARFVEKLDALEPPLPDAESYKARALAAMEAVVYPAYERLGEALRELAPQASHDAGIWRLPNGPAVYRALIAMNADSDLTGEEIHRMGLAEVERIHAEMDAILDAQGFTEGTIAERMTMLSEDPRFVYPNTDEGRARLLADLNAKLDDVKERLPEWFATIPGQPVEVRRIPEFSEDTAPGGYASFPAMDGSRPGIYWINLRDTSTLPSYSLPTLTYHEGLPGHLFQGGIAVTRESSPILRTSFAGTNAFVEGWALYAERLAKEMGLYDDDPWGDLGRLNDELHRAIRLVTDTGMHAMRWSREQALAYMIENEGIDPASAEIEIERYAAWPAQALGYKMGMLKMLELRERAEAALGDDFDLREFHDVLLLDGGLPLPVLEARVDAWIAEKRGG